MLLTQAQVDQAELDRLARLSAQSDRDDVAIVEIIYKDRFVRFDISTMQAHHLTAAQLVARCFVEAFEAVHLETQVAESSADVGQSSVSTLVP